MDSSRTPDRAADRSALQLAGLLAVAGAAHFAVPKPFDAIVPRVLPGRPRTWTCLLYTIRDRFLAVLPANVQMAADWQRRSPALRAAAWARVPLQVPLVVRSLRAARGATGANTCPEPR